MTETPGDEAGEWVSITEAAQRLTAGGDPIDRSTLSRYVAQRAEALATRREGKANLVEFGALAQHRAENVRLRRGPLGGASPAVVVGKAGAGGAMPLAGAGARRFVGSQSDGVARKAQADAEMREMDLAERRGELTVTGEVDQAGRNAVALLQAAFERAIETEAASLSVKYGWDERTVRIALKGFMRRGLEVFNHEMLEWLDGLARKRFAAEAERSMPAAQKPTTSDIGSA